MSQENVEIFRATYVGLGRHENLENVASGSTSAQSGPQSPARGAKARSVLIRYRVVDRGFPATVDQRLIVFDDGAVELDERHRSRDSTWVELEDAELRQLRLALERVPARCWSKLPKLAMLRAEAGVLDAFTLNPFEITDRFFELRRGRRKIAGDFRQPDYEIRGLVEPLDALRLRAVRLHPL